MFRVRIEHQQTGLTIHIAPALLITPRIQAWSTYYTELLCPFLSTHTSAAVIVHPPVIKLFACTPVQNAKKEDIDMSGLTRKDRKKLEKKLKQQAEWEAEVEAKVELGMASEQ